MVPLYSHADYPENGTMQLAYLLRRSPVAVVFALTTFVLIANRAVRTADPYWDTLAYHWPFAARIAGLCDVNCFLMPPSFEYRYEGFPKLWHAIQGLLWRVTGTPTLGDLLSIAMVVVLCLYLNRRFRVPLAWSWLALLAIPEVQIQLTSSYVDLPLNAGVALALMVLLHILVNPAADQRSDLALAVAGLALAANGKPQLVVVSLFVWTIIVLVVSETPSSVHLNRRSSTLLALSLIGGATLLPHFLLNLYTFGNPFYPIAFGIGRFRFPGPEAMMQTTSISDTLQSWPSPARWLASVMEFDAFRGRPLPWTLGQGDVPQSSPSFRMGGYFVSYVLGVLAIIGWRARTLRKRQAFFVLSFAVSLSLVCAALPLSHELRYYMFWMLTMVSAMLALVNSPLFASPEQAVQRNVAHALVGFAAASVILMTGAAYLQDDFPTLEDLASEGNKVVAAVPEGGTLCILNHHPRAFLYSELFHPSRHYKTKSLWTDEQVECTNRVDLGR